HDPPVVRLPEFGRIASLQRRAAGEQRHGEGRSDVVLQRAEPWILPAGRRADEVGVGPAAAASAVANEVIALAVHGSRYIRRRRSSVLGEDGITNFQYSAARVEDAASAAAGGVGAEGGTGDGQPAPAVVNAAAEARGVSAERGTDDGQRAAAVVDGAADSS